MKHNTAEDRLKEMKGFLGRRLTDEEQEEFEALTDEDQELQLGALRALNRPWEAWEREVGRRLKRSEPLRSVNNERQNKAARDYQEYRDIASILIAKNQKLRRASGTRLAQDVRAELIRRGRGPISTRTIRKALRSKN